MLTCTSIGVYGVAAPLSKNDVRMVKKPLRPVNRFLNGLLRGKS